MSLQRHARRHGGVAVDTEVPFLGPVLLNDVTRMQSTQEALHR